MIVHSPENIIHIHVTGIKPTTGPTDAQYKFPYRRVSLSLSQDCAPGYYDCSMFLVSSHHMDNLVSYNLLDIER